MTLKQMKALVYEAPETLNMRDVDIPDSQPGEVLVRVEKVGICGSELGGYLGHNSLRVPPLIMGHEFSGSIADAGSKQSPFKTGDRVTVNPLVSCGHCSECTSGAANLCRHRNLLGAHRSGAFAEYVAVPWKNVYPLPGGVSFEKGALVEPAACAVRLARVMQLSASDRLLIMGAGPIGLFALQAATIFGSRDVVVMDINEQRLATAEELGGIAAGSQEELETLAADHGFDITIDAVGMDVTRQQCMKLTRPGGRVAFSGLHADESTLPVNLAIRNELSMMGSFAYNPADFEQALDWVAAGRFHLDPWTMHAGLEEGDSCFRKLLSGPGKVAKIMLSL